jgi:hypothetical protein
MSLTQAYQHLLLAIHTSLFIPKSVPFLLCSKTQSLIRLLGELQRGTTLATRITGWTVRALRPIVALRGRLESNPRDALI